MASVGEEKSGMLKLSHYQSLRLIDFHLLFWRAQQRLLAVLDVLTSMFKTSAQLRLENLALRQQLTVCAAQS